MTPEEARQEAAATILCIEGFDLCNTLLTRLQSQLRSAGEHRASKAARLDHEAAELDAAFSVLAERDGPAADAEVDRIAKGRQRIEAAHAALWHAQETAEVIFVRQFFDDIGLDLGLLPWLNDRRRTLRASAGSVPASEYCRRGQLVAATVVLDGPGRGRSADEAKREIAAELQRRGINGITAADLHQMRRDINIGAVKGWLKTTKPSTWAAANQTLEPIPPSAWRPPAAPSGPDAAPRGANSYAQSAFMRQSALARPYYEALIGEGGLEPREAAWRAALFCLDQIEWPPAGVEKHAID